MKDRSPKAPSSQKRLSDLRDRLNNLELPSYPDDPFSHFNMWGAEAIAIIRADWPDAFDDFNTLITVGSWTNLGMNSFMEIAGYGGTPPGSIAHRQAWDQDLKVVQELCQKALHFLDGLLRLPPKHKKNSYHSNRSTQITINGDVSGSNIIVGDGNDVDSSQK